MLLCAWSNPMTFPTLITRKGCMGKYGNVAGIVKPKNARKVFDEFPKRVFLPSINLHGTGHVKDHQKGERVTRSSMSCSLPDVADEQLDIHEMVLDKHDMIRILNLCGKEGSFELGKRCHTLITKTGLVGDEFVCTSLMDMYAKCGDMESAVLLFGRMTCLDVATCNCLISGYAKNGMFASAFSFFIKFDDMGIEPNRYTYSILLSACGNVLAIKEAKQLHSHILKLQYLSEPAVGNALLTMYSRCGLIEDAESVFNCHSEKNLITWTAMINGFYQSKAFEKALKQFLLMRESGIQPRDYAFTVALASCSSLVNHDLGQVLHAQVIKLGMSSGVFVGTAIIDMYSALGKMDEMHKQLRQMKRTASTVSWNALLTGLVRHERTSEAIKKFQEMVEWGAECNEFTYSIVLKAASSLPSLAICEQIHSLIIKSQGESDSHIGSSLIEAYAKSGNLEEAEKVFSNILEPDLVSRNSMIKAYSQNGYPQEAIYLFRKLVRDKLKPTSSTFLAVLSACSHSGLVQEGQEFFKSMVSDYNITPEETHHGCMVDLLGRAGLLENALDYIRALPTKPTASMWKPLLAACRSHNNLKMAELVAKNILELDPNDPTVYVTLSNMYAESGRSLDVEKQRNLMTEKEVRKEPGCSWMEVNNKIHTFYSRDRTHLETPRIYQKLKEVMGQLKEIGYSRTRNLEPQPESGEDSSLYHSEKLAVCFGLINVSAQKPIRVFKNLRVCADCHTVMKYISRITEKDIVLRDNYRFHHFKKGCCSCGDYW